MRVTQLVYFAMAIYKLARGMCPWLFKAIVLGFSLLTLSKTESEITCPEGSEVEGKYGHLTTCCSPNHLPCGWAGGAGEGGCGRGDWVLWQKGVASPAHVGRSTYFNPRT